MCLGSGELLPLVKRGRNLPTVSSEYNQEKWERIAKEQGWGSEDSKFLRGNSSSWGGFRTINKKHTVVLTYTPNHTHNTLNTSALCHQMWGVCVGSGRQDPKPHSSPTPGSCPPVQLHPDAGHLEFASDPTG